MLSDTRSVGDISKSIRAVIQSILADPMINSFIKSDKDSVFQSFA